MPRYFIRQASAVNRTLFSLFVPRGLSHERHRRVKTEGTNFVRPNASPATMVRVPVRLRIFKKDPPAGPLRAG